MNYCNNGHELAGTDSSCEVCADLPSHEVAPSLKSSLSSLKVRIGIGMGIAILIAVIAMGLGGSSHSSSGSPAPKTNNKISKCTLPLSGWVMYVENGLNSMDGGAATRSLYYTFGSGSTADWVATEAAQYLRESFQIGNVNATVNMAKAVRVACSRSGYPKLPFPPNY